MEIKFSSFSFSFSFLNANARSGSCGHLRFSVLLCIFEFKIVNADRIAVLDAHLLQTFKESALAELAVKIHPRLIIVKIDVVQQLHDPRAGDLPQILMLLDPQFLRVACLRERLDILRLIVDHRRQLGQLPGDGAHEILRTGRRCG